MLYWHSGIALERLFRLAWSDNHGYPLVVGMDLQGQLQRACDVAMGGDAGNIPGQFPSSREPVIGPANHDGGTGKQVFAVTE